MRQQLIRQVSSNRQFFRDYKSVYERNEKKGCAEVGYLLKGVRAEDLSIKNVAAAWNPVLTQSGGIDDPVRALRATY